MLSHKTPLWSRVGVFLCLLATLVACGSPTAEDAFCSPLEGGGWHKLARVVDGDTLHLGDGRRVRVLGINAPEMGQSGKPDDPFSRVATEAARSFLKGVDNVRLVTGVEQEDGYGRLLAHVYRPDGANLEEHLLRRGLAFHTPVPPNLRQMNCYAGLERQARDEQLGIWSDRGFPVTGARDVRSGGYHRVGGQVTSVEFRRNWWLSIDDRFTVVVYPQDQKRFQRQDLAAWQGRRVEVKGWVFQVNGQWRMKLETPWVIQVAE